MVTSDHRGLTGSCKGKYKESWGGYVKLQREQGKQGNKRNRRKGETRGTEKQGERGNRGNKGTGRTGATRGTGKRGNRGNRGTVKQGKQGNKENGGTREQEEPGAQILLPGADHGRKIKVAGLLSQRVLEKFKMVDEDSHQESHSTDLSVSGEEGHSAIIIIFIEETFS